jgi:hypothetical protein
MTVMVRFKVIVIVSVSLRSRVTIRVKFSGRVEG